MGKAKQLSMLKDPRKNTKLWWIKKQHMYGGSLDYRKVARPFDSKMLNHVVLKADLGSSLRFTTFESAIQQIVQRAARHYGVKLDQWAIHHDHIHLLIFTRSREGRTRFLRFVTAEIGRWYRALRRRMGWRDRKLWLKRPFTRLVSWARRSLASARQYIQRNRREAVGFIAYRPRHHRLNLFLQEWNRQKFSSA